MARVRGTWLHAVWWSDRRPGVRPRDAGMFSLCFTVFAAFGLVLLLAYLALQSVRCLVCGRVPAVNVCVKL